MSVILAAVVPKVKVEVPTLFISHSSKLKYDGLQKILAKVFLVTHQFCKIALSHKDIQKKRSKNGRICGVDPSPV